MRSLRAVAGTRLAVVAVFGVWLAFFSFSGRWTAAIRGAHYTRTAQIAANTELFVRDGISLATRTFNSDVPQRVYDTPVYQALSALVAKGLGVGVELAGKIVSVLFLMLVAGAAALCPLDVRVRGFFVAAVLASPVVTFYAFNALPDVMCMSLIAVALLVFYSVITVPERAPPAWVIPVCVFLPTLVKPPTAAPLIGAILGYVAVVARSERKSASKHAYLAFGAFAVGLLLNRWIYVALNEETEAVSRYELSWYFGTLEQRTDWHSYWALGARLVRDALGIPVALLCMFGATIAWRERKRPAVLFSYAAVIASLGYLLVFFNLCVVHNYYHLPLVPLLVAATACFLTLGRPLRPSGGTLLAIAAVAALAWLPRRESHLRSYHAHEDGYVDAVALRELVPETAHLVRVTREPGDWDPSFHYWAHRFGRNTDAERLPALLETYRGARTAPWFVYVPAALAREIRAADLPSSKTTRLAQGLLIAMPPR